MSYKHNEKGGTRNDGVNTSNLKNDREHLLPSLRITLKGAKMGSPVRSDGLIAINDRDETSFRESSRLISGRSIANQGSRCIDEEACLLIHPLDFDPTIAISR